jgi:hypothetical protein
MGFNKIDVNRLPPRQWSLVGDPAAGKSTFAAQMAAPMLVVDADHRFAEVARLADGDVYELSKNPADHVQADRIVQLLRENMQGSGVRTVVVDSLTSILTPLVVEAVMRNDAGQNKNRMAAFKDKALAMRYIQDAVTSWGTDTLWIFHTRQGLDSQARKIESTSISPVELARLRRSLNMELRVMVEGSRRGIRIDWARRGRSGFTLWDDSGRWLGMPDRIEHEVYSGLTVEDMERIETMPPASFTGPASAIAWGFDQGVFSDALHAQNAYNDLKAKVTPRSAQEMWNSWIANVQGRKANSVKELA